MKVVVFASLFAVGIAGVLAPASAQQPPVKRNERYCLQEGGIFRPSPYLCRYETLAQCHASKTGPSDYCFLNPRLKPGQK